MRMNAVLSNPKHPEYGQFTVPLPIPHNQYDGIMEALNAMDMGDPLARDCQMDEILGEYPILKRLEGKPVNIDELDYLAKRLDSFCYAQEGAQFQGAAVSYDYSDMTDLINLTFSCQQVTVITDFSDLEQVGRDHYMVLNGGCASKEELDALDGYETALLLIDEGNGVITPYGVVYAVKLIAEQTGMDYETLIGGEYKILLEPIAYYKYEGVMIATTATEAAMYDEVVSGHLRTWMGSLTHKNLPLSMFLETADLGYPAWSGSTTQHATNSAIKSSLGLGIVRFEEQPEEPTITTYDYEYRTNTEVITAVEVSGGQSDPDNPVTVRFNILGTTYTVSNVYYPDGDSQLAWVRWTTPDTPQDVTITVSVSGPGSAQGTIQCKIVDLDENPPPNPVADDRNDSFSPSAVPSRAEKTSAQWSIWRPWWYAYWVWHSTGKDSGYWCDHGWWEFDLDRYSASLSASMTITPDTMNPTASGTTMKSGYGINEVVTARVSSSQRSATTALQNAVSYFPEFNYDSFWRLLDRVSISSSSSRLEFQTNEYSTYNRRTHFTPIWYPDGAYTVNTWVLYAGRNQIQNSRRWPARDSTMGYQAGDSPDLRPHSL